MLAWHSGCCLVQAVGHGGDRRAIGAVAVDLVRLVRQHARTAGHNDARVVSCNGRVADPNGNVGPLPIHADIVVRRNAAIDQHGHRPI